MPPALRRLMPVLSCFVLIPASSAWADIEHRFSGFATFGLTFSDNENLAFRRDVTQDDGAYKDNASWKTDSLVGGQWQGRWSPEWEAALQVVAKDRFKNNLKNSVEWAFVRYRPVDGLDVRVGRMGADVFMLSEYRQVGYAMQWVRPPHDYYGIASLYHFDGVDLNKRFDLGDAMINIKAFYGNSGEEYPLGLESNEGTEFDFDLVGTRASLDWNFWKLRYTFAQVTVNSDQGRELRDALRQAAPIWPGLTGVIPDLETVDRQFDYNQIGFSYDNNRWWMQSEFVRLNSNIGLVADGTHFYASIGRRFDNISVYLLAGYAKPDNAMIEISAPTGLPAPLSAQLDLLANATERTLNGVRIKQHSYGVGTRWDFASKMALKFQLEQIDVDQSGTNLWLRTDSNSAITEDQNATLLSVTMDVLF